MADNDTSKIRYDDFISSVQPDPAKPEPTIMLSGFIGHGPDGHARVYPDPTLGTWYDIPEGDILHSLPIADSKLGGSHIWVRANAQIKPGSAAPQAAAAPQQAAAVGMNPTPATHCFVCDPKAAPVLQPTPTVQTHCFICPAHTQAVHCWTAPAVCDTMQMPTPATRCFICPPVNQTPATVCPTHQIFCPTQPVVCNLQPTQPVVCGVLPPSFGCTQGCNQGVGQQALEAAPAPNTAATLCTQQPACPPHTVHNSICICPTPSAVNQCGGPAHPTLATLCTLPPGCPPHTVHNSMCICPTPSAVHQCGGQTVFTPTIPQLTAVGACPTFGVCPSIACTFTPLQNGVFTPFGR
jgi:hypothetical protein